MDEIKPEDKKVDAPAESGPKNPDPKPSDEEVKKAALQKELLDLEASKATLVKAKADAEAELLRVRAEKRAEKKKVSAPDAEEEKVIDKNDPDAKAWIKEIQTTVSPVAEELEKEKQETFGLTLEEFLEDRPATAQSPEKLKEMMGIYNSISTSRTKEGMRRDLDKAYAATFHKELLDAARQSRVENARKDALFSDIAVSRGSTGYSTPKETARVYSDDEKAILAKWEQSAAFPKIKEKTSQE